MEPLKPADVKRALMSGATEDDVAEYNRLIAERFSTNPYLAKSPGEERREQERERRIGDLHQLLFSEVRMHGTSEPAALAAPGGEREGIVSRVFSLWRRRRSASAERSRV